MQDAAGPCPAKVPHGIIVQLGARIAGPGKAQNVTRYNSPSSSV